MSTQTTMQPKIAPIKFTTFERFAYVNYTPFIKLNKTPVKLVKCVAHLHDCEIGKNSEITLGNNLDKWVVQGLVGKINETALTVSWKEIILKFIPENERNGNLLCFRFEFHFEDGSMQKKQSQFLYSIEKKELTHEEKQEYIAIGRLLAFRLQRQRKDWKTIIPNPCGIQNHLISKTPRWG